jgi:hypothetical protein
MSATLSTIWFFGTFGSYVYFKVKRVNHPILSTMVWPFVGVVLLACALSNPNSSIRRTIDSVNGGTGRGGSLPAPAAPAVDGPITRPKYGLIDSDEA